MECVPAASDVIVIDAAPPASVPVARTVAPSRNRRLPVGVPVLADTVALNVTACPTVEGFREELNAVVVVISVAAFTV